MTLHPACEELFKTLNGCLAANGLFAKIIGACTIEKEEYLGCMKVESGIKRDKNLIEARARNERWKVAKEEIDGK